MREVLYVNSELARSETDLWARTSEKIVLIKRAVAAGRDAACMWRSNESSPKRANSLAEKIIRAQCPVEFYVAAAAAFNKETQLLARAYVTPHGDVEVVQLS